MARVDPYEHFLIHGRAEGRTWRIEGDQTPPRTSPAGLLKSLIKQFGLFRDRSNQ
jgi:hypothetical protein